ncbi:MAG TPA: DUF503 domain-containing protein [Chloroflexota bacterium]|nr:DUF503 domain-containing protein [Chloroflexota bacterium]
MVIGAAIVVFHIPDAHSLKEKRHVVRSLTDRVRNRFAVSIAEVDAQDQWQRAVIGLACVSNDSRHADSVVAHAVDYLTSGSENATLIEFHTEIIHAF